MTAKSLSRNCHIFILYTSCTQVERCLSPSKGAVHLGSIPIRPLDVIILALTGLFGMNSSPLVAKIDRTCAAAYTKSANPSHPDIMNFKLP